jgi:uncharacterized SAM-binding protein YcdF (DUF218 family)
MDESNFNGEHGQALEQDAADLNVLIAFLARMDLPDLTSESLLAGYGIPRADLLILLGNGILYTTEMAALGFQRGIAEQLLIVGGIGHSTDYLRDSIRRDPRFCGIAVQDRTEAEMLKEVVVGHFEVNEANVLTETESTNCGANAVEALKLLRRQERLPKTVILVQDPTMQMRSYASFQQAWKSLPEMQFLNYPAFVPLVAAKQGRLVFTTNEISGLWSMDRFLTLVMGEFPRLFDNEQGYGPRGRGYIAHVDIPAEVEAAYYRLLSRYSAYSRAVRTTGNGS